MLVGDRRPRLVGASAIVGGARRTINTCLSMAGTKQRMHRGRLSCGSGSGSCSFSSEPFQPHRSVPKENGLLSLQSNAMRRITSDWNLILASLCGSSNWPLCKRRPTCRLGEGAQRNNANMLPAALPMLATLLTTRSCTNRPLQCREP